jgi:hypothetical protein
MISLWRVDEPVKLMNKDHNDVLDSVIASSIF